MPPAIWGIRCAEPCLVLFLADVGYHLFDEIKAQQWFSAKEAEFCLLPALRSCHHHVNNLLGSAYGTYLPSLLCQHSNRCSQGCSCG